MSEMGPREASVVVNDSDMPPFAVRRAARVLVESLQDAERERDEAREEASKIRDVSEMAWLFPWEESEGEDESNIRS